MLSSLLPCKGKGFVFVPSSLLTQIPFDLPGARGGHFSLRGGGVGAGVGAGVSAGAAGAGAAFGDGAALGDGAGPPGFAKGLESSGSWNWNPPPEPEGGLGDGAGAGFGVLGLGPNCCILASAARGIATASAAATSSLRLKSAAGRRGKSVETVGPSDEGAARIAGLQREPGDAD